ncbi:hypothetical protein L207DRAFT_220681 [Hyaloscypha variabilis F]|uniref:Uncharacterized protein n=1 Tax=Hyaloscypha variabilis (strain UAMH 11265 / GT02V1 / F) TaxID=1149755 RepID=A0A2J6S7M2_HYAVF|nr:hypothetical protein L207DRAFT_220681 [Hyaloscypha variabilis F]
MKATSPLSLLFFLQLASALPIPTKELVLYDCRHSSCLSLSKPNTPPTKLTLSEPHFPSHQLSSPSDLLNEIFDNSVRTPSPKTPPSRALTSSHPLSSAYLLSLSQSSSSPATTSALPSKPTSELPNLRKEDAQRYWASQSGSSEGSAMVDFGPTRAIKLCGHGQDQYLKIQGAYLARQYSDLIVVGIVVLFLAVVVALEACERCGDLYVLTSPFLIPVLGILDLELNLLDLG